MTDTPAPIGTGTKVGIAVFVLVAMSAGLMTMLLQQPEKPLPVLTTLPDYTLTEASGRKVGSADLAGHPYVVDLMFTSCATICPRMTHEMARLEEQTRDLPGVRFVSITVDPTRDTPGVLQRYADKIAPDRTRWDFLTGTEEEIHELAQKGFMLPVQPGDPARGDDDFIHSSRFVLVDGEGQIRGTYDIRDPEALLAIRGDLRRVLR